MIRAMKNALSNLLKEPYTCDYPASAISKPKGYRGLIEFNAQHCIWCDKCEKVCPPRAIIFKQFEDGHKVYNYNPYLCIYCGDCVKACPKTGEALLQSESKGVPGLGKDNLNDKWFEWEREAKQSRENYKIKKDEQKKSKATTVK
jgi:NADH-quinone oxidoreductase subunit I